MKCFPNQKEWEYDRTLQSETKCKESLKTRQLLEGNHFSNHFSYHQLLIELMQGYCEGFWDTFACWPHSPPNTTAELKCPVEEVVAFRNINGDRPIVIHSNSVLIWIGYRKSVSILSTKWNLVEKSHRQEMGELQWMSPRCFPSCCNKSQRIIITKLSQQKTD